MPGTPESLPESLQTLMAFDYSKRRVGIAVGQSVTKTASPVAVVHSLASGRPDWRLIESLVAQWKPGLLIIGLPLNMDGPEQATTDDARRFGRTLGGRLNLPVEWVDERLSTREANARARVSARRQEHDNDDLAAQVILEGWFHKQRN